jgi:trimethylamine--corrinoid protein Co-methyltransferase
MDNETISLIRHLVRGVPVTDETLAVDVIDEIGPQGEFISSEHTLKHMHEATMPKLYHRDVRDAWEAQGATDMATRARDEARRIVAEHEVEPLEPGVLTEIARIKHEADVVVGASAS